MEKGTSRAQREDRVTLYGYNELGTVLGLF